MTVPRRILFVHQLLGAFGGAERYLELLLPALRERGVDPDVALFGARTLPTEALGVRVRSAFDPIRTERGATTPWGVRRAMRRARAELLHWNMPEPFLFRGGLLTALPWGVPSVVTDHLPMMRNGIHYEFVRRHVNRRLAGILFVSESAAAEARAHWPRLPRVAVVHNGVHVAVSRVRTPPGGDEPVRLLFVGRLEQQKRPAFALEVLHALRGRGLDAVLRLAGEGSQAPLLEQQARERGLGDVVELTGFAADPTPYLLEAHFLLAPGEFEGLPLAPLEALVSGLPVLASDIPPHRELAEECAALTVVPADGAEAWAAEAERLLSELQRLSELALAARERFSVGRMADETLAAYERFLR